MRLSPRRWSWRSRLLAACAGLILVLALVPLRPWRPTCGCSGGGSDLRDIYVVKFTAYLRQEGVYYWRIDDLVLLRVVSWLDGDDAWRIVVPNSECKIAEGLSDDQTIDGRFYPASPLVKRLKQELGTRVDPGYDPEARSNRFTYGPGRRLDYCALFWASVLEPSAGDAVAGSRPRAVSR